MPSSTPSPAPPAFAERAWLHAGGREGSWGSLGCWSDQTPDYASACAALTARVADAAHVQPGARVLCLASGAGDELQWLLQQRAATQVTGVERDPALVQVARQLTAASPCVQVLQGDASAPATLGLAPGSFDQVLCVDAAYHLSPREAWLRQAWQLLRPGGWLAYTDLSVEAAAARWRTPLLRGAAALCGLSAQDLLPAAAQAARLQQLGFAEGRVELLTDAVLGGFAAHVRRRARATSAAGARRAVWTARLIPPCRAAGLGYVLLAGRKPSSAAATA